MAGRNEELVTGYRWLNDVWPTGLGEAGCLTVVVGADSEKVLDAFAADPNERVAIEDAPAVPSPHVALAEIAGAVVGVELNGYEGSRPEVLARNSRRGKAASIYWEINGMVIVSCASRGKIVASVDLSVDIDETDLPARLRALLPEADDDLVAVGAAMVERYTGIAVRPGLFEGLHEAYLVNPRPEQRDVQHLDRTSLRYEFPQLVAGIAAADPVLRRRLAEWCATQAVSVVGLAAEEPVREVIAQFDGATVPHPTLRFTQLSARISREERRAEAAWRREEYSDDRSVGPKEQQARAAAASREHFRAIRREFALAAVDYTFHADAVSAALGAVDSSLYSVDPAAPREALAGKIAELLTNQGSDWPADATWIPTNEAN